MYIYICIYIYMYIYMHMYMYMYMYMYTYDAELLRGNECHQAASPRPLLAQRGAPSLKTMYSYDSEEHERKICFTLLRICFTLFRICLILRSHNNRGSVHGSAPTLGRM